jgi:hypothetical protein
VWISICNGGAICVTAMSKQSWHWEYLRILLDPSFKDFLSFFCFPYATSCLLSFILWFPLVLLVPSLHLGNSSTLPSHPNPSSCPSPTLPALHVMSLKPFFAHPLQVPSLGLGYSSTLFLFLDPCCCLGLSLWTLCVAYLDHSFYYPFHKVGSSQQGWATWYSWISTMTSRSITMAPLSEVA